MPQKVAGVHIDMTANSAKLLTELERSRKEVLKLRRTVDHSANRVKYAFNKIRRAAQVVASAFIFVAGIRQLGRLVSGMARASDQVALMQARFQQFAREGDAFSRIYALSLSLGVSLQTTADGMTRLLVATQGLGTTDTVLEEVLQNITLLGRAGGTSAEEMTGGMRQLSQGLAAGRLQGEELRSVLENLPLVAIEIADQMDIALGSLRQVAKEGKITPDVVIAALSEIEIKMEDLPQTWEMQTERLRTEWTLFLNDLSKAVDEAGLLENLIEAVRWVRMNFLGSFVGIPTADLEARRKAIQQEIADTRQNIANQPARFDPLTFVKTPGLASGQFGTGVTDAQDYNDVLDDQLETLGRINKELERRALLDEMAKKNAEARAVAAGLKDDEKRLKEMQKEAARIRASLMSEQNRFFEMVRNMDALVEEGLLTVAEAQEAIARGYDKIMEKAREATEEERRLLLEIADGMEETGDDMKKFADQAARNIQDAFADFLFDPFEDGLEGMVKGFIDAIRRMLAEVLALKLLQALGIPGFLGDIAGKATGGPVTAGTTYMVGERGPELWTASRSGYIVPNHKLGQGGAVITYQIDARGADEAAIVARLSPVLEQTIDFTRESIRRDMQEGRFT